jgi:protocatechuate 3,4-dioxygenase beta subunit
MRNNLIAVLTLLAAWTLCAAAAPQSSGEGTVGGQVVGTDGKAVGGARVTLQPSDGRAPKTSETNSQGRFWFPSLSTGLYDVRAYSKGRESDWHRNVWVERGKQSNVTLHLRPKKPAPGNRTAASKKP